MMGLGPTSKLMHDRNQSLIRDHEGPSVPNAQRKFAFQPLRKATAMHGHLDQAKWARLKHSKNSPARKLAGHAWRKLAGHASPRPTPSRAKHDPLGQA
jgi:hypothetical protein